LIGFKTVPINFYSKIENTLQGADLNSKGMVIIILNDKIGMTIYCNCTLKANLRPKLAV
jgi:hypothetical protein